MLLADRFLRSGKVRDLYELPDGRLLLVASDRISAFDVVLPTRDPRQGPRPDRPVAVLVRRDRRHRPEPPARHGSGHRLDGIRRRAGDCRPIGRRHGPARRAARPDHGLSASGNVVPIEAVVRGYLAGSRLEGVPATGAPSAACRCRPACARATGCRSRSSRPRPRRSRASTTRTSTSTGWSSTSRAGAARLSRASWPRRSATRPSGSIGYGAAIAARRGILLADTKFEFGLVDTDGPVAADPDRRGPDAGLVALLGCRRLRAGRRRRRASTSSSSATGSRPSRGTRPRPGPILPDDVIDGTRARYIEAYERITGASFERYLQEDVIAP